MFTPTITKEMLREMHHQMRERIEAAGGPEAYFTSEDGFGLRLSTSGWHLVRGKAATENSLVAITDSDLYEQLQAAEDPETCYEQIVAEGMPYDTYGENCPLGLHGETGALYRANLPLPDQDPRVVTVDLDYVRPMHWADAHWFDLAEATPVARVRTDCCDSRSSSPLPALEVMLWRTDAGRWVAEIADPAVLGEAFDPAQPAWAEVSPQFAAHAIWCQDEAELTEQARTVPLAAAANAARGARNPGALQAWGMEQIRGDDRHCLAHHDHIEELVAVQAALIAALGQEAAQVWQAAGQVLPDWTWIAHGPTVPHRYGTVSGGRSGEETDTD